MRFRQVHLDFHTSEHISNIGKEFNKRQFQAALQMGHVDSITVFSKCHHGWSYHPTQKNEMHPHLSFDLLGAQIEAAHEIGVKTPVYVSAGFDEKHAVRHADHLLRNRDESTSPKPNFSVAGYHHLCFNTPYLEVLCEQVREVCQNYDADGIFMDISAPRICYCQYCIRSMRERGLDPYDEETARAFGEEVYANYTRAIRQAIDSVKPGLPVFHNSGATPRGRRDLIGMSSHNEIESLPTGKWGYDNLPMISRYTQQTGVEYLGMTGKFHLSWGEFGGYKHPNALIYESALAVANGGKCSIGDQLHPSGKADTETYRLIGEAYKRIDALEPWLDGVKSVADIGLLSYDAYLLEHQDEKKDDADAKFTDVGAMRLLLEGHYLFDILDCESDFSKYKLLILPDRIRPRGMLRKKLDAYVQGGGKLLATGKSALNEESTAFLYDFGVRYVGKAAFGPTYLTPLKAIGSCGVADYIIYGAAEQIELTDGTPIALQKLPYFERTAEHFCSHRHAPAADQVTGTGVVTGKHGAYIAAALFRDYAQIGTQFVKQLVLHTIDLCLADQKTLKVDLPALGIATLMDQEAEKRMILHLLYAPRTVKGENKIEVIEDCVPLYNIPVSICIQKEIKRVYLAPGQKDLDFVTDENGRTVFTVPSVSIHQAIILDYAEKKRNEA